jgi:hypothetical protein
VCPHFLTKKSMNCWRMSLDDGMACSGSSLPRVGEGLV